VRRSVNVVVCALLVMASLSLVTPVYAARPNLGHDSLSASIQHAPISLASGLTIGRIYDTSAHGDVISFSTMARAGGEISGFSFSLPLNGQSSIAGAKMFAFSESNASGADRSHVSVPANAQIAGMQFELLGGAEATVSLQNSGATFGTGPFAASPSQGPAVFDFYNFQHPSQRIGLGEAFGLNPNDAALAASLNSLPQPSNAVAGNSLASPLISSLSAQGPFWYSAYAPPTQGSSMSLTIPFQLAKIPVRVRLGEQAVSTVETSSLATQVLGPAFATSAGNYKSLTGGVTLALPLLSRRATVSLDGWYETLQHNDKMPFNLAPYAGLSSSPLVATGPGAVVYSPTTDVQQYVGAASVALPVTSHLTVNGSFAAQVSGSVALDTLTQSLTQRKTAFGGGVGYNFPKTNSSIDLFFNKNVYSGDNVPTTFTENRQNLYFSVKF
jgi:hypothetical protein